MSVCIHSGEVIISDEAPTGTVTSIDFNQKAQTLAIAAYGEVRWIDSYKRRDMSALKRGASALLSVSVSPDGCKVAVGCLDKTMRLYYIEDQEQGRATDWVGFDAGVSCLGWSSDSRWIAAAGGTAMLVVNPDMQPGQAPVVCRTPGIPAPDCGGGTCGTFTALAWVSSIVKSAILVGIESEAGLCHVFNVDRTDNTFPRKCKPILSISLPGSGICKFSLIPPQDTDICQDSDLCRDKEKPVAGHSSNQFSIAVSRGNLLSVVNVK